MDKLQSLPDACFPNLGIAFGELDRVAFTVFGFEIYWYGIFICIGVILGLSLVSYNAKSTGQSPDPYLDCAFFGIIGGIVGARIYYLIFNEHSLKKFFAFREGGLAIYGGVIGALAVAVVYTRRHKIPPLKFTDTYAPAFLLGQVVGRLGNFVNREAFGKASTGLFSLMYKASDVPFLSISGDTAIYRDHAEYPVTMVGSTAYISVHPTFLYELLWNLCVVIVMMVYRKHKKFEGEITAMYFLFYGIGRFFIESLRTDRLMIGSIPVSMLLSAVMAAVSIVFIIVMRKREKKKNA